MQAALFFKSLYVFFNTAINIPWTYYWDFIETLRFWHYILINKSRFFFLTWFVYSTESISLIGHHSELSRRQTLLLRRGVDDQYRAAQRVQREYKRLHKHRTQVWPLTEAETHLHTHQRRKRRQRQDACGFAALFFYPNSQRARLSLCWWWPLGAELSSRWIMRLIKTNR